MTKYSFLILVITILMNAQPVCAAEKEPADHADLHSELLAYADNYLENLSQIVDALILQTKDPQTRLQLHTLKVMYVTSAVNVVTEPAALEQLLDMLVMVRAQRLAWQNRVFSWANDDQSKRLAIVLLRLENRLMALASTALKAADIIVVTTHVDDWFTTTEDPQSVAFLRYADLEITEHLQKLNKVVSSGGLLAPISDAVREIKQSRMTAERALFLANHSPILLQWQMELFMYRLAVTPEIKQVLTNTDIMTKTMGSSLKEVRQEVTRLNHTLSNILPDEITKQRQAIFDALEKSNDSLKHLLEKTEKASANIQSTTENIIHVMNLLDKDSQEQMTVDEINNILNTSRSITSDLVVITEQLNQLTTPGNQSSIEQLEQFMIRQQNRAFTFVFAGIAFFFVMLVISMYVINRFRISRVK